MLVSGLVADRLVDSCNLSRQSKVLEIGAGRGILTKRLAERAAFVRSFEIDHEVCEQARKALSGYKNLELICGDAFEVDFEFQKFDTCVTSLPYSESLRFLKWIAQKSDQFARTAAILQSEFSDKLTSTLGSRSYRAASVVAQISFNIEIMFGVGRAEFDPPPRVDSQAVLLSPNPKIKQPFFNKRRIRHLDFIFSFRGRRLISALKKMGYEKNFDTVPNEIITSRVETISPAEYAAILPMLERKVA